MWPNIDVASGQTLILVASQIDDIFLYVAGISDIRVSARVSRYLIKFLFDASGDLAYSG